jgi:hypothetical protein
MFLIEYVFIDFITDLAKVAICEDSFFQCQKYLGSVLKKKGSSRKYKLVF